MLAEVSFFDSKIKKKVICSQLVPKMETGFENGGSCFPGFRKGELFLVETILYFWEASFLNKERCKKHSSTVKVVAQKSINKEMINIIICVLRLCNRLVNAEHSISITTLLNHFKCPSPESPF